MTRTIARGVRLHLLRSARFTTTVCRVALHRDLGPEATATAVLAHVMQAATQAHPTREALARALADLYGASLRVEVEKLGDRQVLAAALEWPTERVPRARRLLERGLALLGEVLGAPRRRDRRGGLGSPLDDDLVRMEKVNQVRTIRSLVDDKARYALRRCVEAACRGEPFALDPQGREEDVEGLDAAGLGALHERLLARAPVDVFLLGDLAWPEAARAVGRHLLWPGRARALSRPPPASATRAARSRPRRLVGTDDVGQTQLVMAWRAAIGPRSPLAPAARTLAGVLGGGSYGRLFKVVRETHGLCYHVHAGWHPAKGLLLVQAGTDPDREGRVRRLATSLLAEVASGRLDPVALRGFREAVAHHVASLRDDRGARLAWVQECLAHGLDPRPETHARRLGAVTPAEVRRAGRRLGLEATFALRPAASGAPAERR